MKWMSALTVNVKLLRYLAWNQASRSGLRNEYQASLHCENGLYFPMAITKVLCLCIWSSEQGGALTPIPSSLPPWPGAFTWHQNWGPDTVAPFVSSPHRGCYIYTVKAFFGKCISEFFPSLNSPPSTHPHETKVSNKLKRPNWLFIFISVSFLLSQVPQFWSP